MVSLKKGTAESKKEGEAKLKYESRIKSAEKYASALESKIKLIKQFLNLLEELHLVVERVSEQLLGQSLLGAMVTWAFSMEAIDPNITVWMKTLFVEDLVVVYDNDGEDITIAQANRFDHNEVLNRIRCRRDLELELRENLVKTYIAFLGWLSKQTYNHTPTITDPDLIKSQGRVISLSVFIKFLEQLDDKSQLVAKLLYFGGSRTLDEVLNLELKNVNFSKFIIRYDSNLITYPPHVFEDIQAITQKRSSGRVFIGRGNTALNPATIFHNFKEAAILAGLGNSFTPKSLTTSA